MAGKFTLKINPPGFNEARRDARLQAELDRRAGLIAAAAGGEPDFIVVSEPSATRARTIVITATPAAMELEAKDHVLTRAFDAGRG